MCAKLKYKNNLNENNKYSNNSIQNNFNVLPKDLNCWILPYLNYIDQLNKISSI